MFVTAEEEEDSRVKKITIGTQLIGKRSELVAFVEWDKNLSAVEG